MGRFSGYEGKAVIVAELSQSDASRFVKKDSWHEKNGWVSFKVLDKSLAGNEFWMLVERTFEDAESETAPVTDVTVTKFIRLALLSCEGGDWGYKPMEEACFPYYYNCPQKFLKAAPVASVEWRKAVEELRARKNRKFMVGDVIVLREGFTPNRLEVTSASPLRAKTAEGVVYKVSKTAIDRVEARELVTA